MGSQNDQRSLALPEELLAIWHSYRAFALLAVIAIPSAIRLATYLRKRRQERPLSSGSGSPVVAAEHKKLVPESLKKFDSIPRLDDDHVEDFTVVKPSSGRSPRRVAGSKLPKLDAGTAQNFDPSHQRIQPIVFYFSLGGSTQEAAERFVVNLEGWREALEQDEMRKPLSPHLHDLSHVDYDDFFITPPKGDPNVRYFYLILLPSYNIDTVLHNFLEHMQETHHDFRIDTAPLSALLGYSIFGFGDQEGWPTEEEGFCYQAKEVDKWMAKLTGRKRAFPVGMGDVKSDSIERLKEWRLGVQDVMKDVLEGRGLGEGVPGSGDAVESDEGSASESDDGKNEALTRTRRKKRRQKPAVDDLEDLGRMAKQQTANGRKPVPNGAPAVDFTTYKKSGVSAAATPKKMVPRTSPTYAALTKQGYTIVGSHSGVKICRWTKSALRGRGSCYKFSFYGIKSHLCMETTPSLSCSNKCVFCWRHGTNPVGTSWRWQVDPPEEIFKGVKEGHYKKIKMLKGVPGVRAERFAEAMKIRHCALSLVGEPIFYPHINEFVSMLHNEHISSFLVCNAQHPDQLAALKHVTQLYVSIDASNKDSLRKIDRPLHRDFWERFTRCLDILRERRFMQRTVFRLTLVKGFNIDDEVKGYADLVERGLPCFVEIKGVTYCGTSTSSAAGLTMQNVPFYEEVCEFVTALEGELKSRGLGYGIAAEHAHSCCILIASDRFKIDGRWHTLIGYDKFFECLESRKDFGPEDYIGEATPEWALWGNGGFDPRDERVDRKGRKKENVEIMQ